jgi:hypothetical protein
VTSAGDVEKTNEPEPVSSVTAAAKFALLGVFKKVGIPVPKPAGAESKPDASTFTDFSDG